MSGSHKSKRQKEHRRRQPRQNQEPPQVYSSQVQHEISVQQTGSSSLPVVISTLTKRDPPQAAQVQGPAFQIGIPQQAPQNKKTAVHIDIPLQPLLGAPAFVQPPPEPFVPPYNGNLRLLDHRLISVPGYTMLVHRREGPLGSQNNSPSHTPLPPQNYPAPQDDPIPPQQANFEINITINVQTIIHTNAQTDEESSTESPSPEIESGMDEEGIPGSWSPNPMDWNQSIGATGHSSDDTDPNTSSNDSRPTSEEGDGVRPSKKRRKTQEWSE